MLVKDKDKRGNNKSSNRLYPQVLNRKVEKPEREKAASPKLEFETNELLTKDTSGLPRRYLFNFLSTKVSQKDLSRLSIFGAFLFKNKKRLRANPP